MNRAKNQIVLVGTQEFIGQASYDLIPGFQLVDRDFIMRYDSTGHRARHSLGRELLPAVRRFVSQSPSTSS